MKTTGFVGLMTIFLFMNAFPGSSLAVQKALESARIEKGRIIDSFGRLPLSFEENQGQTSEKVRFLSHGMGYTLYLTAGEADLSPFLSIQDNLLRRVPYKFKRYLRAHPSFFHLGQAKSFVASCIIRPIGKFRGHDRSASLKSS